MDTLDKVIINNILYFDAENVKKLDPAYFYGCSRTRNIVKKKKLLKQDYIYGTLKDKIWTVANPDYKKAKLLLTQTWITSNVPKLKDLLDSNEIEVKDNIIEVNDINYNEAPPILEITNEEKFKDSDGNCIDIEIRGEREYNKCYFKVQDVSKGFNMHTLQQTLNNDNTYDRYIDFNCFIIINYDNQTNKKMLFLTYEGMIKLLYISRNSNAKFFRTWATEKLFTIQMGSDEQKYKLSAKLLGVSTNAVKEVFKKSIIKISCVYLFSFGFVKDLRKSFNIPIQYDDNSVVIKYGRTDSLERRTYEHEKDYGTIDNVDLRLMKYAFIDSQYTSEAEADLTNFFNYSKYKYDFPNRNELAIIPKDKIYIVEKEYEKIRKIYAGNLTEIINEKEKLINELRIKDKDIELIKEKHKYELQLEQHKVIEEKHKNEILQMKLIIANMNNTN